MAIALNEFESELEKLLGGLSSSERKRALLKPRTLVENLRQRMGRAASQEFYLPAAEAVLALRCGRNITTPFDATDATPVEGLRTRTFDRDRVFRDDRRRLRDDRCQLLLRFAGLELDEIAKFLDLDIVEVYDLTDYSLLWRS